MIKTDISQRKVIQNHWSTLDFVSFLKSKRSSELLANLNEPIYYYVTDWNITIMSITYCVTIGLKTRKTCECHVRNLMFVENVKT